MQSNIIPEEKRVAGAAGLEPVTSAVTGQRSNQLSYTPAKGDETIEKVSVIVKAWFGIFEAGLSRPGGIKNPGSRRQGGGGGEPR